MMIDLGPKAHELIEQVFRDALRGVGTSFPNGSPTAEAILEAVEPVQALEHVTGYPDGDEDDPDNLPREEPESHGLRCPYCGVIHWDGEDDGIRVVDIAIRWNPFGYDHENKAISGSYDNDADFEGDHYECESCGHRVELPDDVEENGW